ncbi:Rpn family recombination-promoting nuclease/putative transposase [Sodalis sp. (in: enterobacteria)]|uniref:Rpn family recombination-promoting nuclease/putative transposase n=1 Tax=Sodalis sp. (in: enterobacteria) TaxID=1898979 RepID=UPI003F3D9380
MGEIDSLLTDTLTQWLDCFTDPELAESVYRQAFPLVDITAMPDDEILSHRRVALLELVQKHIRTRDMLELAADIARLLNLWAIPKEQFRSLMYYIVGRGETSDTRQFLQTIAAQTQDYREDVMTIAEQLRQEGRQEGIQLGEQKGRQEGLQEGRQESARSIAHQLIANGVERSIVKLSTGLSDQELDELARQ